MVPFHAGGQHVTDPVPVANMVDYQFQRHLSITQALVRAVDHKTPKTDGLVRVGTWNQRPIFEHNEADRLVTSIDRAEPGLRVKIGLGDRKSICCNIRSLLGRDRQAKNIAQILGSYFRQSDRFQQMSQIKWAERPKILVACLSLHLPAPYHRFRFLSYYAAEVGSGQYPYIAEHPFIEMRQDRTDNKVFSTSGKMHDLNAVENKSPEVGRARWRPDDRVDAAIDPTGRTVDYRRGHSRPARNQVGGVYVVRCCTVTIDRDHVKTADNKVYIATGLDLRHIGDHNMVICWRGRQRCEAIKRRHPAAKAYGGAVKRVAICGEI